MALALLWQAGRLRGSMPAMPGGLSPITATPHGAAPEWAVAEGRVVAYPGGEVGIGSEASGRIVSLPVQEKSIIRKGDLIAELMSDDLRAELAEARARVAEAEAEIGFAERELRRIERLHARQAGTLAEADARRHDLEVARARREAGRAACDRCLALIAKTRIIAPIDGVIVARFVHPGETVEVATTLVTIADLARLRVEAEVDEFDIHRVALGADVRITVEGYGDTTWRGTVEEIPDTVVPRRIRPEDPSRPTDSRVLLVKIALAEATPLKLGQRVEVAIRSRGPTIIETGSRAKPSGLMQGIWWEEASLPSARGG
jgi:RND family efflux transporter MFP subunit